jgi:hypothetical protein
MLHWNGDTGRAPVEPFEIVVRVGLSDREVVVSGPFATAIGIAKRVADGGFWAEDANGDPVFTPAHEIVWVKVPRPRSRRRAPGSDEGAKR